LRKVEPERCERGEMLSPAEEIFSQARHLLRQARLLFSNAGLLRGEGWFFPRIGRPVVSLDAVIAHRLHPERSLALDYTAGADGTSP
jgi:hypothetical protein